MNKKLLALLCFSLQTFAFIGAMESRSKIQKTSKSAEDSDSEAQESISKKTTVERIQVPQPKIYELKTYNAQPCWLQITDDELRAARLDELQVRSGNTVGPLTRLRLLTLHSNQLTAVPALGTLTNLQQLGLGANQLTALPDISTLTNLQKLGLDDNQLREVPALATLTKLHALGLDNNQLTALPDISNLTNLQILLLDDNQLREVPALATLTNLQRLTLDYNQLREVPDISTLTNLQHLWLAHNQLTAVPALATLTNLQELGLAHNQLREVPDISTLTNLHCLWLSRNQLGEVPALGTLTNLRCLWLSHNQLREIPDISTLTSLQQLVFDYNPLTATPTLATLTNLQWLGLSNCLLNTLPVELAQLPTLKILNIMNNPVGRTVSGKAASVSGIVYKLVLREILKCSRETIKNGPQVLYECTNPLTLADLNLPPLTKETRAFTSAVNAMIAMINQPLNLEELETWINKHKDETPARANCIRLRDYTKLYIWLMRLFRTQGLFLGNTMDSDNWNTACGCIPRDARQLFQKHIDNTIIYLSKNLKATSQETKQDNA